MKQQGEFLTAEWNNLPMLNYVVHPSLLEPFVPSSTELDEFHGGIYVSVVGFEFNRTRVGEYIDCRDCAVRLSRRQLFVEHLE